ncbi:tyrosine-type recombinase/integrase [Desulfosediminicola sp.]|uniref:tyrosine-type recombinase/integrase n=1 Tax=Desulfosediminicola sp. TaxID=2886825 RepID=UPI003AF278D9
MPLTDTAIRNAKPKEKPYKLTDGRGLYLLVNKSGKYFRWDYRFAGKRKTLALGVYPDIRLKEVREKHEDFRRLLAKDIDPMEYKKKVKAEIHAEVTHSFESVSREWFLKNKTVWTEKHAKTVIGRLENNVFPWLGNLNVGAISAPVLLETLRRIEERGANETAHRVKQICGQVFKYAIATGRAERDPSADLKGALSPTRAKSMATITDPNKIGQLMRAIHGYEGHLITRCALKLAPLLFVRPGELRHAEWDEIDLKGAQWKIPAEKMKMRKVHIVPLSSQAVHIFHELQPLTGSEKFAFPSLRSGSRPMSNNTVNAALRRMGYSKEELTGHGFRSMASTLLHENGWNTDVIERQLAHVESSTVKRAYNHAEHLPERRKMMQWWADYLDGLMIC